MPDNKISNLSELAEVPASDDMFVVVDKSDTTMSASGTTKKIQSQYVVPTIADATFSVKGKSLLIEGQINGATSKTTPVNADEIGITDSASSYVLKKLTWSNLKATLKTYFDSLTTTLTNKRITPRNDTVVSSATPTINTDTTDMFTITALAAAITSMTTNLSGTPTSGQKLIIRIKDDGTARAITWGASFVSRGATLPTTTVLGKYTYVGFLYNSVASVWDCVDVKIEGATNNGNSKIITATRDYSAVAGDVAYTGVGFTPTSIRAIFCKDSASVGDGNGFSDSSKTSFCVNTRQNNGTAHPSSTLIYSDIASGQYISAIVKSYDADGFTLTWSKTGSPTGTLNIGFICN